MPNASRRLHLACAIAGAIALAACGGLVTVPSVATASPSPAATATPFAWPSPSPSGPSLHDLSGVYVFGSIGEPSPGPVATCYPRETLSISQLGGDVSGQVQLCTGPCYVEETLSGSQLNGQLTLRGWNNPPPGQERASIQVTYQLHFDAASQHLVGTRNDQPYWAAPYARRPDCGPAPL